LIDGDRRKLADYTHEEIAREAGSGGHEIRTWITLAGALPDWKATLLAYEPVVPRATASVWSHSAREMLTTEARAHSVNI
jgi:hypothetical protein